MIEKINTAALSELFHEMELCDNADHSKMYFALGRLIAAYDLQQKEIEQLKADLEHEADGGRDAQDMALRMAKENEIMKRFFRANKISIGILKGIALDEDES